MSLKVDLSRPLQSGGAVRRAGGSVVRSVTLCGPDNQLATSLPSGRDDRTRRQPSIHRSQPVAGPTRPSAQPRIYIRDLCRLFGRTIADKNLVSKAPAPTGGTSRIRRDDLAVWVAAKINALRATDRERAELRWDLNRL